jgi:hypothetical protein
VEGIRMDDQKIKAIDNLNSPTNVKDLQTFLGMSGYYRKFIKNYAHIASPLYALLKPKNFSWSASCENSQVDKDGNEYVCSYASRILKGPVWRLHTYYNDVNK